MKNLEVSIILWKFKEEKNVIDAVYHSDYRMDCYLTWVCHGIHFLLSEFRWHSEHWIMYHHIYHYCSIINAASDY